MRSKRAGKAYLYLTSFLIPVLLLIPVFALHGIFPFGDNTVMTGDMEYQFIDYLAYLKTIIFGNNDFSYSFSKNLGGSMAGFSAYYYYSPLNLVTLFFPNELLPVAESLVILLTAGLSSLTMSVFLCKKYGGNLSSVMFSAAYALCGFSATYFQLTMYAGNMILFPLIILGFMSLIENPERRLFYIFTLSAAIIFNYYSAYMICLFLAVLFIIEAFLGHVKKNVIPSFVLSSAAAVLLSSFTLIPAVCSLSGEKNSFSLGFFRSFSLIRLPLQFLPGAFKGDVGNGLPNVYCGILTVVFFFLYIINKKEPLKERIVSLALVFFLIINLWINTLNILWHGLNRPIGFPYRYSYMLSFVMIICAYKGFSDICESCREKKVPLQAFVILITAFQLMDLAFNYYDAMGYFELASLSGYQESIRDTEEKLRVCREDNKAEGKDGELYRIEKFFRRTNNDSMQFNYAGLTHYSSSEKKDKINFMGKLGFRNNGNWSFYNETSTCFLESFFGVKYILAQFPTVPNMYEKILKGNEIRVFKNENALPLIFNSSEAIRDVDYNGFDGDPFLLQEAIADSLNGEDNKIFEKAEILSIKTENLTEEKKDGFTRYSKVDGSKEAWIEAEVRVKDPEKNLFAYFDAPDLQRAELYKDGVDYGEYFTRYRWNIMSFHRTKKADSTVIRIGLSDDSLDLGKMCFYFEDRDKVGALMKEIRANDASFKKITSSHISGSITVPEGGRTVVITVPYDKAWTLKVDGKYTDHTPAAGMLMSFDTDPGEHKIEMRYIPKGSLPGRIISIVVLLSIMGYILYKKKEKRNFNKKSKKVVDFSDSQ